MIEYIFKHILVSIHAPLRIFYNTGELKEYYGNSETEDVVLTDMQFKDRMFGMAQDEFPLIYQDFYPVLFCVVRYEELVYITGPVNCNYTVEKIDNIPLGEYFAQRHSTKNKKYRISFCEFDQFCEENLLLFNVLSQSNMTKYEMLEKNYPSGEPITNVKKQLNEIYFRYQENEKVHNSYDQEVRELDSIREGNIAKLIQSMDEPVQGEYGTLSREPLRNIKNLGIVTLGLSARAAIDGGLSPEESFSMDDAYILQVDQAPNEGHIMAVIRRAKIEFATLVNEKNATNESNRIVEEAKRIIYKNLHSRIMVRNIAQELAVTPEYLSTLFRKSEGITVNDYIIQKKIGLAENLLIYSNYSIEEIGYYLGFCSQSHFGKYFKKWKEITPKQYRMKYGLKSFLENSNQNL